MNRRAAQCVAHSGFTLIEVLVALTIVAITLGAGIKAAGALTGNAQRLAEVSAAQWCADNQLVGLKLLRQYPGVGDSRLPAASSSGFTYSGKLVVRPTPNPNFRRVDALQVANEAGSADPEPVHGAADGTDDTPAIPANTVARAASPWWKCWWR